MRKLMKRIVPVIMLLVMCVCSSVPAFAASTTWQNKMRTFPLCVYGTNEPHVGLIQAAMYAYNYNGTRGWISDNGGIDCSFGIGTKYAVMAFQSVNNLSVDGEVGPNTWGKIGYLASKGETTSGDWTPFSLSSYPLMTVYGAGDDVFHSYTEWYYYRYDAKENEEIYGFFRYN